MAKNSFQLWSGLTAHAPLHPATKATLETDH